MLRQIGSLLPAAVALGVTALGFAGCAGNRPSPEESLQEASQELRQAVTANIEDPRRRDEMLGLVGQIESVQRDFSAQAADFAARFEALNVDYDASRAQFEKLFADFNSERARSRDQLLDMHFQLTALATEGEWKRIGKAEARLYGEVEAARADGAGT